HARPLFGAVARAARRHGEVGTGTGQGVSVALSSTRTPTNRGVATKCYMCYSARVNRTITQRELRNQSAAVLRQVEAGRTLVVTRNGTPVAELRPIRRRRFVARATIAEAAANAPRV